MIHNQSGFSILSVLMATAMAGVLGFALMSLMKNSSDMYQIAKLREAADSTRFIANAVLQNEDACKKSLIRAGLSLASIESKQGVTVRQIVSTNDAVVMTAGEEDGPRSMILEPLKQNRNIASLSSTRYLGQLRMKFGSENSPGIGGGVADRILPVALTLNGTNVVACKVGGGEESPTGSLLGDIPNISGGCGSYTSNGDARLQSGINQDHWRQYCRTLSFPQGQKTYNLSLGVNGDDRQPISTR